MDECIKYTKNVVLTDFEPNSGWSFLEGLEKGTNEAWTVKYKISNRYHGNILANIRRILIYFLFPLQIVWNRSKYEKIVAWQQFYGLNFAFWMRVFGAPKKQNLIIMTYIYKPKKGLRGKIYHYYMNFIVSSIYIDHFVCFSKKECEFYAHLFNEPMGRFCYIPLGMERLKIHSTERDCGDNRYIFSTGRSNRDYDFLINTIKGTKYQLYIACDNLISTNSDDGIVVDTNCYGEKMLKKMLNSYCVVVSLRDTNISSGQLVVLQAMQMGKPVIVTKSLGIEDYIEDGETGLLVEKKAEDLLNAIKLIYNDKVLYEKISKNSKQRFEKEFTMGKMAENIASILKKKEIR